MAAAPVIPGKLISKKLPSSASVDDIRRYLHSGVICDNCDKEIRGYRYKCLECADFDLCMECEPTNHSQHLMLRIANPNDAEICHRAKLGKRFGRHRRSESLCSKPTEDRQHDKKGHHDKKAHHKRHVPFSRSANFADVVSDILKSVVSPGADVLSGLKPNVTTQGNQNDQNGKKPKTSSTATSLNTPSEGSLPLPTSKQPGNCEQLKTHIDTLSNMAQHFAEMMDPFATYINETTTNIANEKTPVAAPKDSNVLGERVQDILKTLTPDNIDSVFEQLNALNIDTNEKISEFVSIIFKKAINEPHLSAEIAKLARKLIKLDAPVKGSFVMDLMYKCMEFQMDIPDEHLIHSKLSRMQKELSLTTDQNRKMELNALIEEERKLQRNSSVATVRFIGELYRENMLPTHMIEMRIIKLLDIPSEEKMEYLCTLLTLVGQKMETVGDIENDNRDLTKHFQIMQDIVSNRFQYTLSTRVRSMLLNLIELRKNNWVQRSEPMDGVNATEEREKPAEPQKSKQLVAMVVDCSDDEEENIGMLNRAYRENSSDGNQSEKSNRGDSPSREWAFVNANEIDDMAQASASAQASTSTQDGPLAAKKTGTLPKQVSKQSQNAKPTTDEPSLDYSALSRRLNDYIIGERKAATIDECSFANLAAAPSTATREPEYVKASESQSKPLELPPKVTANATANYASRPSTGMLTFDNNKLFFCSIKFINWPIFLLSVKI